MRNICLKCGTQFESQTVPQMICGKCTNLEINSRNKFFEEEIGRLEKIIEKLQKANFDFKVEEKESYQKIENQQKYIDRLEKMIEEKDSKIYVLQGNHMKSRDI